jgi:UDP-glucose 4-epimerase
MEYSAQGGSDVFNVCTGTDTNILALANELGYLFRGRGEPDIRFGPPRPGDPWSSIGDPGKAKRILGFHSTTDIGWGLAKTFNLNIAHKGHNHERVG